MAGENKDKKPIKSADLYIGIKSDFTPFTIDLKALTRGLVVVGQSGCGKSFLLGRIVEELISKTTKKTQLIIVDTNSDFWQGTTLKTPEAITAETGKYLMGHSTEEYARFAVSEFAEYEQMRKQGLLSGCELFGHERGRPFNLDWGLCATPWPFMQLIKANNYTLSYSNALQILQRILIGSRENYFNIDSWTETVHLLLLAKREAITNFQKLKNCIPDYCNITDTEFRFFCNEVSEDGLAEFENDLKNERFFSKIWKLNNDETGLFDSIAGGTRINVVEIETIGEKSKRNRLLAAILMFLWTYKLDAAEACKREEDKSAFNERIGKLRHTFILIDEAHNFAPNEPNDPFEKMLGELIHQIAAEGRKYGLHLILATQRPNKVKRGLLGEFDNAIIMKMNSRSDLEHLAKEMRILDVKLLEPALHFQGQGNAIAIGEMTKMAPYTQIFKTAPRRTKEGGVDIEGF